jgi:anti-sigma factor RsiW
VSGERALSCAEFVELVTDYLEGALDEPTERRFVEHADACPGCDTYLDQIRATVAETGRLTPEQLDPEARDRLLDAFRGWASGTGPV